MIQTKQSETRIVRDIKIKLCEERTKEFAVKFVELQVRKDILEFNKKAIKEKEEILKEEKQCLAEIDEKIYKLQNKFCDSVWKFSKKHDFGHFFVNYPRKKIPTSCNCEFYQETAEKIIKGVKENEEIRTLSSQVTTLKLELETWENKTNLEEEIKSISKEVKVISAEDNEIQRLTKILETSQQELESLEIEMKNLIQKQKQFSKNSDINQISKVKIKRNASNDKKSIKKCKITNEISDEVYSPSITCLNTIDNYLILKRKPVTPVVEKISAEKEDKVVKIPEKSKDNFLQQKSKLLNSWTPNSNISSIENSIEKTLKMIPEQNSIFPGFTPKKQSAIAEKFLKQCKR